jgi:hypothetical protein
MIVHFEHLWDKCEKNHDNISSDEINSIISELELKINLYKSLNNNENFSEEDLKKIKSRMFGEILFTLTKISLKENINVYVSLKDALLSRLI